MVRKTTFTRDDIIQAGFELVDQLGLDQLTARNLAEKIGSSTAPVYSNFSSMDQLEQVLVEEAVGRLIHATRNGSSGNQFLDIGLGVLDFAWEHPRWYDALFLGQCKTSDHGFTIMEELLESMAAMPDLAELHATERTIVLKKMAIFTHGLATEICSGQSDNNSREESIILLDEVGRTVLADAMLRGPRSEEELRILGPMWHCDSNFTPEKEED